ncbi:hypothetical protein I6N90_17680 [Paenibacillus sp. GSMTC-2017]|uniref:hypothetical protein n=1 Tax=Paenibacillus sp. GSMTC-2017 TaxID=2794350 RepID=UPI0018D98AA5|nr:hypothetical protein [Paenibacillus sp. GSMTC-2017]MBH5319630.1 hypothetical protein [Paenibacillus sp. GSMTC-2017]
MFIENDQLLTIGISLDFVVVLPLLLYFFFFRKQNITIISALPFALVGYLGLVLIIPATGQETLEVIKYILIPLEIMLVLYQLRKIFQAVLTSRRSRLTNAHPIETLRESLGTSFKHSTFASLIAHELSVFYYAVLSWRKKPYLRTGFTSFSYHTESNWLITILLLSKILLIEGAVAHILLMQWSHIAAWVLTFGNVYIIITMIADYRATRLNPILLSENEMRVQYGLQMIAYVDSHNVESVSLISNKTLTKEQLKTSFTPIATEPNVHIQLKNSVTVIRMFGKRQIVDNIYLFLDKPREFQLECHSFMDKHTQE